MSRVPFVAVPVISNAGGEGKTTLALIMEACLDLLGRPVDLVDIDEGNGSISYTRSAAHGLSWGMKASAAPRIYADLQMSNLVFDFGANCLASSANVVALFWELAKLLKNGGHRMGSLIPVSTNKPGACGAAIQIAEELSRRGLDPCFVQVNRGGSDRYDGTLEGFPVIKLGYLDTGYMEHLQRVSKERSLAALIREPEPDYELATQYIAQWLRKFASQKEVINMLGGDIRPILDRYGYRPQPRIGQVHLTEPEITNRGIREQIERTARFETL